MESENSPCYFLCRFQFINQLKKKSDTAVIHEVSNIVMNKKWTNRMLRTCYYRHRTQSDKLMLFQLINHCLGVLQGMRKHDWSSKNIFAYWKVCLLHWGLQIERIKMLFSNANITQIFTVSLLNNEKLNKSQSVIAVSRVHERRKSKGRYSVQIKRHQNPLQNLELFQRSARIVVEAECTQTRLSKILRTE